MLGSITGRLHRYANWKTTLIGLAALLVCQFIMGGYLIPNIQSKHPQAISGGLLTMVDFTPFITAEEAYRIFNLYQPDIVRQVQMFYGVDFVLPLAIALVFFGLIGVLLKYLEREEPWNWLILIPFLIIPFDYGENSLVLFMVSQIPAHVYYGLATFTGILTALKLMLSMLAVVVTGILLLMALVRYVTSRAKQQ